MIATNEFKTAMQQLSAEAKKALTTTDYAHEGGENGAGSQVVHDMQALNARLENLELALTSKIDNLPKINPSTLQPDVTDHLQLIEDQLSELVSRDRTTQKLIDTLHAELLDYRDNFVRESLQRPFIHDLVLLFDDLTALAKQLETAVGEQGLHAQVARWHENLQNAIHSLVEILHRFDVKEVETKETFDRAIHRVVCYEPAGCEQEDGKVAARVRRGFIWRGKLIRPEEVIVKKFG
jgi:molecular chaperone GrpE (heat shock protein)